LLAAGDFLGPAAASIFVGQGGLAFGTDLFFDNFSIWLALVSLT
jgi:hypothetical protein